MDDRHAWRWQSHQDAGFVRRVLIVLALVALALLVWHLVDVLLLAFGAVLVAVVLCAFADAIGRLTPIPRGWALTVATLTIFVIVLGAMALFGSQIRVQLASVAERLPLALNTFTKELGFGEVTSQLPQMLGVGTGGAFVSRMAGIGGTILGAFADLLLVVIAGVYIAASPTLYREGLIKLFPVGQHERVAGSLDAAGRALKLWLTAQLIAMACVAVLTSAALWLIGVPSAFALGVIAGLADFIPFVGPIIGALPAVLIAFTVDGHTVLWTILAFVAIQQVEGNIIFPLVGERMVSMPPALALFAILTGGVLFGALGLVFGYPLAVVVYVLVKKLYVRETLGEETPVPGEKKAQEAIAS